ncbi:MAG: fibronectin type III domain-containing protein [Treponema sp.]|jgi:hypothetical protein|nr:fibronectin type III domain-containing protein [Treponema sp.]
MNKKVFLLFGIIALAAVFGLVFAACPMDSDSLSVTARAESSSSIKVSWESVSKATSYKLYRGITSNGEYSLIQSTSDTSYTDTGLSPDSTYYYKVSVVDSEGKEGSRSEATSATTQPIVSIPVNVTATAASSSSITISWTAIGGVTGYKVYRSITSGGTYSLIRSLGSNTYTDTGLPANTSYYYTVSAVNAKGTESRQSGAVSATTQPGGGTGYAVGSVGPAGGYIFYDKGDTSGGWRYLEAAPAGTEFTAQWGAYNNNVQNTNLAIGTGKQNTETILIFLQSTGEFGRAAQRCDSLSFEGYSDWFLPSLGEVYLMWENLKQKGLGGFSNEWYWSSSQSSDMYSWYLPFSDGTQATTYKSSSILIRAVRAF